MNSVLRAVYAATGLIARVAASVFPPGHGKIGDSFALRRGVESRYARWGTAGRDLARPLLWMHAPSVGEGLQALPVLDELRERRPGLQIAYTYYSPSARAFAGGLDVDFQDVLPFDTRRDARAMLDALQPTVLAFSKLDVWPFLVEEAAARNVRLALISATLPAQSSRLKGLGPALLRDAYGLLDAVGAVSADDAQRLLALGCRPAAIEVTGDTRFDQVWRRSRDAHRNGALLGSLRSSRLTLVAGSTWPADEQRLLPAFLRARAVSPGLRMIIAPHEPADLALTALEAWARKARLDARRLEDPLAGDADVVLVDRVGVLGDLYALADIAFVGGGFHSAGLHSVLEPAAFGVPVAFGPMHGNSRDAIQLAREGAGASAADEATLSALLATWVTDDVVRGETGRRARAMVESGTGATTRTVALLERLMSAPMR